MNDPQLARDLNARLQRALAARGDSAALLCECGGSECMTWIDGRREQYELARERPNRLLVAAGHLDHQRDRVVAQWGDVLVIERDTTDRPAARR